MDKSIIKNVDPNKNHDRWKVKQKYSHLLHLMAANSVKPLYLIINYTLYLHWEGTGNNYLGLFSSDKVKTHWKGMKKYGAKAKIFLVQ